MAASPPARPVHVGAVADLHGELPEIEPCDLLVIVGDINPYDIEADREATREWLAFAFAQWLEEIPAEEVIAVAGNHDFWALDVRAGVHEALFGARWTYLRDAEVTTRSGLRVYGSPWTRQAYDTAFEASPAELTRIWSKIPTGLDVLAVHSPPLGHGDQLSEGGGPPKRMGAPELTAAISRTRPQLVLFGHAHEAFGFRAEDPPGTTLANVTVRTDYRGGLYEPSQFTLSPR